MTRRNADTACSPIWPRSGALTAPTRRIVAAGSTGSIPATRALLQVIATLPRGTVVLPGLDQDMDEASWRVLTAAHPQYGLKQLLDALDVERAAVRRWPAPGIRRQRSGTGAAAQRSHAACGHDQRLAAPASPPPAAIEGLAIEQHPDLPTEALGSRCACARRSSCPPAPPRSSPAIASSRAASPPSCGGGASRSTTPPARRSIRPRPGAFLLLTARLVVEGVTPVALLAALKHPFARHGQDPGALREQARALELACLRGPRLAGGFGGMLVELRRAYGRAGA